MNYQVQEEIQAPPLKWAGGKRWLLPHLKRLWPSDEQRRLVELFCGGLSVSLGLMPGEALLNDISPHLINFYQQIQTGLPITLLMQNDPEAYYQAREQFNRLIDQSKIESAEAAQLFYYLNRTGFNGLCRFNKRGYFNVPFGKYKTIHYLNDFSAYQPLLSRWQFQLGSFETVKLEPTDFVYADPPYDATFTGYSKEGFTWGQQTQLAQWLYRHTGPVVISNQATDRIIALYKDCGFHLVFLNAPRRISASGDRTPVREVLAVRGLENLDY